MTFSRSSLDVDDNHYSPRINLKVSITIYVIEMRANYDFRIVLPLRRVALSEKAVSKPIPTLSDRQFVVARDKLSRAEVQLQKELFWYREALFKSVHGHWKEVRTIDPIYDRDGKAHLES
jgi:hypothetical protein